ncbi:MAG TPA: putative sulfate exporter family transporter [Gemmatimonadales bacterium]|nr:putative sulfate exporter family transporter [Gemmatimonadales bacterium]
MLRQDVGYVNILFDIFFRLLKNLCPSSEDGGTDGEARALKRFARTSHLTASAEEYIPGLALCAVAVAATTASATFLPLSPLVLAMTVGILIASVRPLPHSTRPGLAFSRGTLLKVAVALLGARLAFVDLLRLTDPLAFGCVILITLLTFAGTLWIAARLGISAPLGILVAAGYAICGASAVAAFHPISRGGEGDAAKAIGLVTLFGTAALVSFPVAATIFDMNDAQFGYWAGAGIHDVAQVVATASTRGDEAVDIATAIKLVRVAMLGPLLLAVTSYERRSRRQSTSASRPPLVPWFVAAFLVASLLRSVGLLPQSSITAAAVVADVLLASAMFAFGSGTSLSALRGLLGRPLVLGLTSWILISTASGVLAVSLN